MTTEDITLWNEQGQRLYLTPEERDRFKQAAKSQKDHQLRTFCHLMVYTGCRISEALELSARQINWQENSIVLRSLKKRGKKKDVTYRSIPVPGQFLDELDMVHRFKTFKTVKELSVPLWSYSRTTAWRKIKALMQEASIEGDHANPKGLRHGFGVAHAINKTPLPLIQRWMGHSSPQTTAIYMQVTGEEERKLAGAVW